MKRKTLDIQFAANYREWEYGKTYTLPLVEAAELIATGHARLAQPSQDIPAVPSEAEAEAENEYQAEMVPVDR
jgi:hypothetical protein